MVALRGKDIDSFLGRPDPGRPIILLYGPDAGLVRERADALLASAVDDPNDPFSMVRLDGDELAAEPSRLVEEAMTVPLFGGRRGPGSRSFAAGVDTLAEMAIRDCRIVIEAGDKPLSEIIASIEKGILVGRFSGGNPAPNGDFSGVAKNSFLIENGKIGPALSETMISGNFAEMLFKLRDVSKEQINAGIFVVPYLAFDGIIVSGK